jgi:hypothetical protein
MKHDVIFNNVGDAALGCALTKNPEQLFDTLMGVCKQAFIVVELFA